MSRILTPSLFGDIALHSLKTVSCFQVLHVRILGVHGASRSLNEVVFRNFLDVLQKVVDSAFRLSQGFFISLAGCKFTVS